MKHFPISLCLEGHRCVVVGAGTAAAPRIFDLVAAGARVAVVAPHACAAVDELATTGKITHHARVYAQGDLDGCLLAYAATGDDALHERIAADAASAGVLLNVVDRPRWCDFITPAIVRRGRLTLAISTGGASPALARRVRQELEAHFGPEYATALELLARLRPILAARGMSLADKQERLGNLVAAPLLDHVRAGRTDAIDQLLANVADGLSLAALGMATLEGAHE